MPAKLSNIRPFKSFLVTHVRDRAGVRNVLWDALSEATKLIGVSKDGPRRLVNTQKPVDVGQFSAAFVHYSEVRPIQWLLDPSSLDHINHLVFVCRRGRYVAFHLSDTRRRDQIADACTGAGKTGLAALELIPAGIWNGAFLKGPARTLWMSGTHRRISVKADNKILSGADLRDALDPLGDQTYSVSAARCMKDTSHGSVAIGVVPHGSRLWLGPSKSLDDCLGALGDVLGELAKTKVPEHRPIPVVAVPVEGATVTGAFDVALLPPEIALDDPNVEPDLLKELERWAYSTNFDVRPGDGASFAARVLLEGVDIGDVQIAIDLSDPERVGIEVSGDPTSEETREAHSEALRYCRQRRWLKVWYESGHSLADGAIYEIRHRDLPFDGYLFSDFAGYSVIKEKPDPIAAVGTQDSLFCWLRHRWPLDAAPGSGWLACDDGAMEIADFIHLDQSGKLPGLSLIHVKAAGSAETGRGVSVSKYEVVAGQAVKNLRALDREVLAEGMAAGIGKRIGNLVWHDGQPSTREDMIAVLAGLGASYRRRVVILQPHLTRARLESARTAGGGADRARLRQLDTLLLSAENSCHGLGATLEVIGEA